MGRAKGRCFGVESDALPSAASLHEAAGRRGALPSAIKPLAPSMTCFGPALPVRCPSGDNLWLHRALDQVSDGDVLVADCGLGVEFGYWGEIMASAAIARGCGGLVITGGVRDSLALIKLAMPTFAGRICIQGTGKNPQGDGAIGEPVRIGEVIVRRGDLVCGDADGVCVLPSAEAEMLVRSAQERERNETAILEKIRAGASTRDVYNL